MAEGGKDHHLSKKRAAVGGAAVLAGTIIAGGFIDGQEGQKPSVSEIYEGTVKITKQVTNENDEVVSEARIREWPDIPHGSSAAPNTYNGWPWESNVIYIKNPRTVDSYDPATGDSKGGIWIEFPVDGDNKYIAWSSANFGVVEALPGGKFIDGSLTPDGGFSGNNNANFEPGELSVVTTEPPK
ncbi:MAG: hypothetical protein A3A51_02940 [Candidatus Levybacteria bacterium RIFCSPLOWO2_01_FULL_39_10]|nr:MAG: hypothetical protein A3A51_02940 [Candidatus Levybacteria bacterium RIFCSPLOWO2_01_FULL_39_10]